MLSFSERVQWRLKIPSQSNEPDLILRKNISDDDMTVFHLAKQGYGTVAEIKEMDTKEFLDLVEYEHINNALERHYMSK